TKETIQSEYQCNNRHYHLESIKFTFIFLISHFHVVSIAQIGKLLPPLNDFYLFYHKDKLFVRRQLLLTVLFSFTRHFLGICLVFIFYCIFSGNISRISTFLLFLTKRKLCSLNFSSFNLVFESCL